ncbi:MAG: hypothetical protein JW797_15665 [Bradymonadales bacterium]|nr:hypothetical protein [Bradymonadales bacterium]
MLSRLTLVFSLLSLSLMWIACGDDEPSTTPEDTGTDQTVSDTGDMAPDIQEDPSAPDESPDTTPDVVEEPDAVELPEGACNTVDDCEDDQECIGGGCVDPVDDIEAYAGEAAERPNSFTWKLQLPSLLPDRLDCCFEYDGNLQNGPDNALGDLLPIIQMALPADQRDLQSFLDYYVEDGTVTLVVDWTELPVSSDAIDDGDVRLSWFLAEPDPSNAWLAQFTGTGDAYYDWVADVAGTGIYYLDPMSFGDYGSLIQFNRVTSAEDADGNQEIFGGPSTFHLNIPPIPGYFEEGLLLTLERAMIQADIELTDNGVHTVDAMVGEDADDQYLVGGGRLGGVVGAPQVLGYLNDFVERTCLCAGVDPGEELVMWSEAPNPQTEEMEFVVECAPEFAAATYAVPVCCGMSGAPSTPCTDNIPGANCCVTGTVDVDCCSPDSFCNYIPEACGYAGVIGMVLDTDLNGNGAPDGLSAALLFSWTGAYIEGIVGTSAE